jgi:hypothetical protein
MADTHDGGSPSGPHCLNCGSRVTQRYVAVFAPDDLDANNAVRTCPNCRKQRRKGKIRPARGYAKHGQEGELASYQEGVVEEGD